LSKFPKKHLTIGGNDPFLPSLIDSINHADEIAIAAAFIRMTGLELIQESLEDALSRGARVRILTGDYLAITEPMALKYLMLLRQRGAHVKIFESKNIVSFHMKAYIFTKSIGQSISDGCAFVGSSNLTKAALVNGLEWNLKVDCFEDVDRFRYILSQYEDLYNNDSCTELSYDWIDSYSKRFVQVKKLQSYSSPGEDETLPPPDPNPVQHDVLTALKNTRQKGYKRGLVVLATGLGKTWLSAFDSVQMNAKRILFVAHREEILNQAEDTFIRICPDSNVGRYTGSEKEIYVDILFASIQTLGRSEHLNIFGSEYFDYIIIDEFHHAAAYSYRKLLQHFKPKFLLGLTATPERTDQSNILSLCDDNLVYNYDLLQGIENGLLCPFDYYGIADEINYQEIPWRNGKFEPQKLESQLATHARAKNNLRNWRKLSQYKTLAFCVSQKHADFMSSYFNRNNIKSVSVHSNSDIRRNEALSLLELGKIQVIFSVDLFNEGIDLPAIDTVLMLRPTESKIVFLQQLGRGLRINTNKDKLVVIDFIGNHISFFRKAEALFDIGVSTNDRRRYIRDIEKNTLDLPKGCFMNYDIESINFMKQLTVNSSDKQLEIYNNLKGSLGYRPSLAEFYRVGGSVEKIRKDYGQWHELTNSENDLNPLEIECLEEQNQFLLEIEKTALTKSFKLVTIEALIDLDGFNNNITTLQLAEKCFEIIKRRPLLIVDIHEEYQGIEKLSEKNKNKWHQYWLHNPINAWVGGNTALENAFFEITNGCLIYKNGVSTRLCDVFNSMLLEIVEYRYIQYEARLSKGTKHVDVLPISAQTFSIPFFSDLKVACGHFRHSEHKDENLVYKNLPSKYGELNNTSHFLVQASGNSMDGGENPIKDGDYLLFELATENTRNIMKVAETQPSYQIKPKTVLAEIRVNEGDKYLLRTIQNNEQGILKLVAQNNDYPAIEITDDITLVASLKSIVEPIDLYLHESIMRQDIPPLLGHVFNKGSWESGHVCPKHSSDQILLVTLNKQGKNKNEQYHDYFIDEYTFHWQSQNSTSIISKRGKGIIQHQKKGSRVYLFVRKNKLQAGKASPFIYCGEVIYQSHKSEKPMNVIWKLETPLSKNMLGYFQ
jgi:superfamily II DNA or RNA helicase